MNHIGAQGPAHAVSLWGMPPKEPASRAKINAGLRLRAARMALGIRTVDALANILGQSRAAVSNWEVGIRMADPLAMVRLWERTGITLEWIYGGSLRGCPYELATELRDIANYLGAPVSGDPPSQPWVPPEGTPKARPKTPRPTALHERRTKFNEGS